MFERIVFVAWAFGCLYLLANMAMVSVAFCKGF
jgi:hypothetical protein